jgi:hypothetical protein
MNIKPLFLILAFALVMSVVGCQKQDTEQDVDVDVAEPSTNERSGGLDATNELVLGTLWLENTTAAVTPEQAAELLPLWQIVASGSLKSAAETEAVLKQIEGKMSDAQLVAIEAMALSGEDMQAWMEEQGIEMPAPAAGAQDGPGAFGDLSEDERASMRDQFQNMSAQERATRMAEMGVERPEGVEQGDRQGGVPGAGRRPNFVLAPLIDLLTARAAQ